MKYEPSISGNELYMIAKTIFDNKELVLSPKVLNIFNFKAEEAAKDDTGNYVVNLVKSKIQSVQNAVNFYEPGKDSDINDQNYKGLEKEMTKLKMQMQKFELCNLIGSVTKLLVSGNIRIEIISYHSIQKY